MIFTARMKQLIAVVLDRDADKVIKELLRQSVLHYVSIREIADGWSSKVESVNPEVSDARIAEIRKRIESFLEMLKYRPAETQKLDIDKLKPVDLEATNKSLDTLASRLQGIRERQRNIQQEILKLEDIRRQLELFGDLNIGLRQQSRYSFLNIQTGSIPTSRLEDFSAVLDELPSVQLSFQEVDRRTNILLITMKRDEERIDRLLDEYGWLDLEVPGEVQGLQPEAVHELDGKIEAMRREQDKLKAEITELIEGNQARLEEMWANLRLNELYTRIQSFFSKTSRTVLFSGWLPAAKQKILEEAIRRITGGRCYLEWHEPREVEPSERKNVPVQLKNPQFLSPFQMLVKNYAIPEYGTIDPTPFVAIAYLAMFGLMFGDAGHGAVLLLIGLAGSFLFKKARENARDLLHLIAWCGGSAIVTGVLFGSYFGMQLLPPLWFDYHGIIAGHPPTSGFVQDVFGILIITIYFGISVIGLGLLLNWVNRIAKREWFDLFTGKAGLLGGWIYSGGVYLGYYFVTHDYKEFPASSIIFLLVGLPTLLLILKPPLEFVHQKREDPAKRFTPLTPLDFMMEWIVELLEIYSSYLANTLSFMRVAGLGIAHVSLMLAFFQIAAMRGSGEGSYTIGSYLILIFGNVLVIGLEGLTAGIQSLRLNYYEFFSKYFSGSGKAYAPVTLKA